MAKKRRKRGRRPASGRATPKGDRKLTGRDVHLRLAHTPSDEERHVLRQAFSSGWVRWLPIEIVLVLGAGAENSLRAQGEEANEATFEDALEELDREQLLWELPKDDDDRSFRDRQHADAARFSRAAGMEPIETLGDLVNLARHYGLVIENAKGRLVMADPLPLVGEAGVLDPEEVNHEDEIRWRDEFEPLAQRAIGVFVDEELDQWTGTLRGFAQVLEAEVEDTRQALALLVTDEDFSASTDLGTVDVDQEVTVVVDWEVFDRERLSFTTRPSP